MTIIGTEDDATLVAAAQAGDRSALDALLRRHYDRVHAICRRVSGSSRDADDAAQEAMISIVRGLPRFDGRAAFTTWIYRIATNAALDEARRRGRRPMLHAVTDEDGPALEQADPLSHRLVEGAGDRMALDAALAALPEEFRTAVVLRDVGDLDYAEIAETLGVPVGTVKSRIARGRMLLARALRHDDTEGSGGNQTPPSGRPSATSPDHPPPAEDGPRTP
ncbi:RNA polymerase sigma factor [Desertimonas flava]|uniref:RNA polymerase sigma factor n=1 Tax=Desertimonas flava TaxID=2064846 RepID=UPI000E343B8A|nr:RNA polymerase sigma factor [Desertimonas flava]